MWLWFALVSTSNNLSCIFFGFLHKSDSLKKIILKSEILLKFISEVHIKRRRKLKGWGRRVIGLHKREEFILHESLLWQL